MTPIMRQILTSEKVLAKDSFTRADNALDLGYADKGGLWTQIDGSKLGIVSNQVYNSNDIGIDALGLATVDAKYPNVAVEMDIVWKGSVGLSALFRGDGTNNNRIIWGINNFGDLVINRRVGGASTTLGTIAITEEDGRTYRLKVISKGNDFNCYLDGQLMLSLTDDNVLKTNTRCGLLIYMAQVNPLARIDNFKVVKI